MTGKSRHVVWNCLSFLFLKVFLRHSKEQIFMVHVSKRLVVRPCHKKVAAFEKLLICLPLVTFYNLQCQTFHRGGLIKTFYHTTNLGDCMPRVLGSLCGCVQSWTYMYNFKERINRFLDVVSALLPVHTGVNKVAKAKTSERGISEGRLKTFRGFRHNNRWIAWKHCRYFVLSWN